jgi:hypothetical protein
MQVSYDDGRTELLRNLTNQQATEKLAEVMNDPHFSEAVIRREIKPGMKRTPKKSAPLSELMASAKGDK